MGDKMKKKIYIDADSLLYRSSHLSTGDSDLREAEALEEHDADDVGLELAPVSSQLMEMRRIFHSMTNDIVRTILQRFPDADPTPHHVITVKSSHKACEGMTDNFRYNVMSCVEDCNVKGYKENRKGMEVPEGLDDIYQYVYDMETTICEDGVEADDVVVYYGRQGHIVAALDKDVIGSLELAYNYGKIEWVENEPDKIAMFPYIQTIMGDTSDGLRGVYRVGAKGAEKALYDLPLDDYELWKAVVKQYVLKDQTIEEAIATMRCVRMDQWTPEEGLVLWTPPKKGE